MNYKIRYGRTFPTKQKYSTMKIEIEMEYQDEQNLYNNFIELAEKVESLKMLRNNIYMEQTSQVSEPEKKSDTREVKSD